MLLGDLPAENPTVIVVVGAPGTKVNDAEQQGVAYIYMRSGDDPTAFTLLKTITGSDSAAHHSFGWSVGIHGDTLVVGNADTSAGAVYVFERNQGGANHWGEVKKLVRADNRSFTYFGRTLAVADINSDGCRDVVIADSQYGLLTLTGANCRK